MSLLNKKTNEFKSRGSLSVSNVHIGIWLHDDETQHLALEPARNCSYHC